MMTMIMMTLIRRCDSPFPCRPRLLRPLASPGTPGPSGHRGRRWAAELIGQAASADGGRWTTVETERGLQTEVAVAAHDALAVELVVEIQIIVVVINVAVHVACRPARRQLQVHTLRNQSNYNNN